MEDAIFAEIIKKSKNMLYRHAKASAQAYLFAKRFKDRTGIEARRPEGVRHKIWDLHPHFDPEYCLKHAGYLARAIWGNIRKGNYTPVPALTYLKKKDGGGTRNIMVFTIPDSAVSNVFFKKITDRNIKTLSPNCFSYRTDGRNRYDAFPYPANAGSATDRGTRRCLTAPASLAPATIWS